MDIDSDFLMLLRISMTFTLKDYDVCIAFVYLSPPPPAKDQITLIMIVSLKLNRTYFPLLKVAETFMSLVT